MRRITACIQYIDFIYLVYHNEKRSTYGTNRLILRRFQDTDSEDLLEYLSDEEVVHFEPYKAMSPKAVRSGLNWRIFSDEMIAVVLKDNGKLIGNIYLGNGTLSHWKSDSFSAKYIGIAIMQTCFREGTHRIYAECDPENEHLWRLLERLGFVREVHLRKNVFFWRDKNGVSIWKDTYVYARLNAAE